MSVLCREIGMVPRVGTERKAKIKKLDKTPITAKEILTHSVIYLISTNNTTAGSVYGAREAECVMAPFTSRPPSNCLQHLLLKIMNTESDLTKTKTLDPNKKITLKSFLGPQWLCFWGCYHQT